MNDGAIDSMLLTVCPLDYVHVLCLYHRDVITIVPTPFLPAMIFRWANAMYWRSRKPIMGIGIRVGCTGPSCREAAGPASVITCPTSLRAPLVHENPSSPEMHSLTGKPWGG